MTTRIVLIGGGGHALSVMSMLPDGIEVAGYVDNKPVADMPVPYLGTDSDLLASEADVAIHLALVWGRTTDMRLRRKLIDLYRSFSSPTIVAPSALITETSTIGRGCAVMHRAVINGARIGHYSVINTGAIIEHGVTLGENVFIGPGAVICGGVTIGNDSIIGAGATVRQGINIASGSVVGMGAAVVRDITEPGLYTGIPAKCKR